MAPLAGLAALAAALALAACSGGGEEDVPVPTGLPGGAELAELPEPLRRFEGLPVVGAALNPLPFAVSACPPPAGSGRERGETVFESAWLSPLGVSVAYTDAASGRVVACDAPAEGDEFPLCGHAAEGDAPAGEVVGAGRAVQRCGEVTFAWVGPPEGADWALVLRESHWVAYPLGRIGVVRVALAGEKGQLVYVDEAAAEIGRESVETG